MNTKKESQHKPATPPIEVVKAKLKGLEQTEGGWKALCPAHKDTDASLSIAEGADGRVLLNCFAGCETKVVAKKIGLKMADLFERPSQQQGVGGGPSDTEPPAQGHKEPGLKLGQYAAFKKLPLEFLAASGLEQIQFSNQFVVKIPYLDQHGAVAATRFRFALEKKSADKRFSWKRGSKPQLYGLWKLAEFKKLVLPGL